ncbi:GNAT family N-acetyltransferase [uncultured Jatrophihabitans sp.]|uniref:GNAT family N-acetyltransferase n=1 Tax=uncultured Jatrophihabitans sp. TaxID=1610747 RepID=UPI0035CA96A0
MTRSVVRVRPAGTSDVPDLTRLIGAIDTGSGVFSGKALADPSEEHLTERLHQILAEPERVLLVAVAEDEVVVGMLAARCDEIGAIDLTPVLHVTHLLVAPRQRRRGTGRALLAGAVHLAEDRGVDRILATAAAGSREANRYLARLGFAPLVVHRLAPTTTLRRSLGMTDAGAGTAVLRRARLARSHRPAAVARAASRGA